MALDATGRSVACRLAVLVTISAAVGCARPTPAALPVPQNVLIVTIDTLRADRLGVYGAKNVATPVLDRLAREGAWAPQAVVQTPLTRPSHISIFSGRYPAEHGVRDNEAPTLGADVPLLAEVFQRAGFTTAAFVSSAVVERQSGLARGFETYSDRFGPNAFRKSGDAVTSEAIAWLKGRDRFFAWVHLYDLHAPYEPPGRYATQYAGRPYDGCVAWSDELVGRLIDALRDDGVLDRTLVVVTSDHGESLGEHGEDWHGFFVYESTLRVPLIVRGPGVKPGTQIGGVARSIDLFPTMAEMAGLGSTAPATSGRSFAEALRGGAMTPREPSFAESLTPLVHFGWSDLRAMRDGRWKYIQAPRPELYDLDRDPGELRNLVESEPARARELRAALDARLASERAAARTAPGEAGVPPALLEKLGALGYLSRTRSSEGRQTSADPKDKVQEYRTLTASMAQGLLALNGGRPAEAVKQFQGLIRRGVDTFDLRCYLGRAYTALHRYQEAAAEYEQAVKQLPAYDAAWRGLGESRASLGDRRAASKAFERLVALAPGDALARMQLGETYGELGRFPDAIRLMREAVAIDPNPAYWSALGTILGGTGQMPEAERAFAESVARDATNPLSLYNHGLALQHLGRRDEAIAEFRRAAALGSPQARAKLAER